MIMLPKKLKIAMPLLQVLEESPCGRWHKRREEVQQRDIPGIDAAYLAMDTEEGVEV